MKLMEENVENNAEVKWEDQKKINEFAKLNNKFSRVEIDLEVKQKQQESLEDSLGELELLDEDENVNYKVGDSYFLLSIEKTKEIVEEEMENVKNEINNLKDEMKTLEDEMKKMKKVLYERFGQNINLERD
jgi:prefoldin subunit 4